MKITAVTQTSLLLRRGPLLWHIFKASTHHPLLCHLSLRKTLWGLLDIALSIVAGCNGALIKYIEIINSQYLANI